MAASTTQVAAAATTVAADKPSFFENVTSALRGFPQKVRDLTAENSYDFRANLEVKEDDNIFMKISKVALQVLATIVCLVPALAVAAYGKVKSFVCTSAPAAAAPAPAAPATSTSVEAQ